MGRIQLTTLSNDGSSMLADLESCRMPLNLLHAKNDEGRRRGFLQCGGLFEMCGKHFEMIEKCEMD